MNMIKATVVYNYDMNDRYLVGVFKDSTNAENLKKLLGESRCFIENLVIITDIGESK